MDFQRLQTPIREPSCTSEAFTGLLDQHEIRIILWMAAGPGPGQHFYPTTVVDHQVPVLVSEHSFEAPVLDLRIGLKVVVRVYNQERPHQTFGANPG